MTQTVLGKRGSTRRRWTLLLPFIAVLALSMYFIAGAQAVHDLGVFELDTGTAGANAVNESAPGDDWDNVCYSQAKADGLSNGDAQARCTASVGVSGATAFSWTAEPNLQSTIFTGGGSKDPIDISSWAFKNDAGGLPDKDNLLHAFAVRYAASTVSTRTGTLSSGSPTVTGISPSTTGLVVGMFVSGTGIPPNTTIASVDSSTQITLSNNATASGSQTLTFNTGKCGSDVSSNLLTTCDVIYFGLDRFDNSGDAQSGFWFLQNEVKLDPAHKIGGGFGFSGVHKNGDLLIVSDFSNGGTTSTITVYKWDSACKKAGTPAGCADANLRQLATANNALCGGSTPDPFCGIVNFQTTNLPWSFTDKSGTASNGALTGELYEAGVNLSSPQINLGGECFASIVSETRSSTSTTATLKDFVLGGFGKCESGITTQQRVTPNDNATVTVTGKTSWQGTVDFTLYDGSDCGTTNSDGTAGPTILYQEDTDSGTAGIQGIAVYKNISGQADTTFPVNTSNASVFVPSASGLTLDSNGAYNVSWKATFTSGTSGVPNSFRCEATTGIKFNDDVAHG